MRTLHPSCSGRLLETARAARRFLTEESRDEMVSYLLEQMTPQGGFKGRSEQEDLYYTVFGIDGLLSLEASIPVAQVDSYVKGFLDGDGLDLVHLSCLCRCLSRLPAGNRDPTGRMALLRRIEGYRTEAGGYRSELSSSQDTVYASFLAAMAYQDLDVPCPDPGSLVGSIQRHRISDAGYANELQAPMSTTPVTAAAILVLVAAGEAPDLSVADWLLNQHCPAGGFTVGPGVPTPDLLSTATALYSLLLLGRSLASVREACLDFVEGLWVPGGGFRGHVDDPGCDVEFTFYGLLALGSLLRQT